MILGITGGTGCGKTTLLHAIAEAGGLIMDCDAIYHQLLKEDPALLAAIENRFPGTVEDGTLNRKKLGGIVFSDPEALLDLNRITHGAVGKEIRRLLATNPPLAAIDAIGLLDGNLASICDVTVAVTAPEADRIQRLMARDGITEEYAKNRIAAQHPEAWFRSRCDYTLENNSTKEAFEEKCLAFLRQLGIIKGN